MSVFAYITKDVEGKYHRGDVEAIDEFHASTLLRRKKLIVISLKSRNKRGSQFLDKLLSRVTFADLVVMTRQLSTMVEAGLVLSESLDILEEQQTNKLFKNVLKEISSDIKGGMDFASALEKHQDIFPSIYIELIRAGQASGKLDTVLLELADNLEKERNFKSRVKGAMIYPVVIISLMIAVMLLMMLFVVPKLMGLYKDSGIALPLPTRIIIALADFMVGFWWALSIVVVTLVLVLKRYFATPSGKLIFDSVMLKLPVIGRIANLVILTNFTRTFSLLVASGLPILESIKIVSDVVGNRVYKDSLELTYKGVERGLPFSSQLIGLPVFPKIVGQMARTGEETGKVDEILLKLSNYFESESDIALKNITTLIEPIVLVLLGIGVAFLVISIILPIYQLTSNIK